MVVTLEELRELLAEEADKWGREWEEEKESMIEELSKPETQNKWKKRVTDPKVAEKRKRRLKEAIDAGLIEKGLEEVDPADWGTQVVSGIRDKTITDVDKKKWAKNFAPYRLVIANAKEEFERLGLEGKAALDWWYENVSEKLHNMKLGKVPKPVKVEEVEIVI